MTKLRMNLAAMLAAPVLYRVLAAPRITDGDTLYVVREREIGEIEDMLVVHRDHPKGVKLRLHDGGLGLDTPETTDPGPWAGARDDLTAWVTGAQERGALYLSMLGRDEYGRRLGDLRDEVGQSVCAWMRGLGWSGYPKPKLPPAAR